MPRERTPEADVPVIERVRRMLPSFVRGSREGDIELPSEGQRDKRLPKTPNIKDFQAGLEGLKKAAGRK
jgi:hypothetical protein